MSSAGQPLFFQTLNTTHLPQLLELSASDPHAWSEGNWLSSLEQDQVLGLLKDEKTWVACLVLGWGYREAEVLYLLVREGYRRQGLASLLLQKALQEAKDKQAERLLLEVRASNQAALALYAAEGFKEDGRRKNYYASQTSLTGKEDAILMSRSLVS
ncbi:ribosomal protein S18-alanine N-acetyltransferase [Marinospirillum sp.]|uniref:ribosomal protein S18-alanine N-acetyltransferase n=1 Tax=Marinospirillum sp. TaxID=2183934 RepID=UPI00384E5191